MSCKVLRNRIMREQNIEIRKRKESIMRRNHTYTLGLFLGGGYLVFRNLFSYAEGLFVVAIFLAWYGYLENYLHRYEEYTNQLIRDSSKKAKTSKSTIKKSSKKK